MQINDAKMQEEYKEWANFRVTTKKCQKQESSDRRIPNFYPCISPWVYARPDAYGCVHRQKTRWRSHGLPHRWDYMGGLAKSVLPLRLAKTQTLFHVDAF